MSYQHNIEPLDADELARIERTITRYEQENDAYLYRTWSCSTPKMARFFPRGVLSQDEVGYIRISGIRAYCEGLLHIEQDGSQFYLVLSSGQRIPYDSSPFGEG